MPAGHQQHPSTASKPDQRFPPLFEDDDIHFKRWTAPSLPSADAHQGERGQDEEGRGEVCVRSGRGLVVWASGMGWCRGEARIARTLSGSEQTMVSLVACSLFPYLFFFFSSPIVTLQPVPQPSKATSPAATRTKTATLWSTSLSPTATSSSGGRPDPTAAASPQLGPARRGETTGLAQQQPSSLAAQQVSTTRRLGPRPPGAGDGQTRVTPTPRLAGLTTNSESSRIDNR